MSATMPVRADLGDHVLRTRVPVHQTGAGGVWVRCAECERVHWCRVVTDEGG